MSDPVALALIATIPPTVAVIIAAMKNQRAIKDQTELNVKERAAQTIKIEEVHNAVNGGWTQAKEEIVTLKAEVIRLNAIIAERVK